MSSTNWGKDQIKEYIMRNVPSGSTCLDVGACDGKYWQMLHDHLGSMDAVEIFQPNIDRHRLNEKYNHVFNQSVVGLEYDHYDLIIFGDIIEHLTVEDAQQVLAYAQTHADEIIVAVPFLYPQPAIYGNPWEEHKQPELTFDLFMARYEGFEPILRNERFCYFRKNKSE